MTDLTPEQRELLKTNELVNRLERERGLKDLYFFDKELLGYSDMSPLTHRPICAFASDESVKRKHIEYPRGTFKSSVITIGYTLQSVARNPDVRILIDNEVYGNSKAFLREIKSHMEKERLLELYPEFQVDKRQNDAWTESTVIVSSRTKERKEPTISCAGLDQIKVGMHYDKIIMDDLVSNRNVTTKEQIEKVIEHYRLALSLLEPGGEIILLGTRYHYSDLYGHVLETDDGEFQNLILPAILTDEAATLLNDQFRHLKHTYKAGDLLFPERLTEEFLQSQRSSQGSYIYNCQYMLDPVNSEEADFKREWLKYHRSHLEYEKGKPYLVLDWLGDYKRVTLEDIPEGRIPVNLYTTVDPNNKKKKSSDYTGSMTVAVDEENNWYVLDMIRDKYNPKEIVDLMFDIHDEHNPDLIGIEDVGKETIKFYLLEQMKKRNIFFRTRELKTKGIAKEDRISRIIPRFETGMIYLPASLIKTNWEGKRIDIVAAFEDEYEYFPLAKNDDLMDALAYMEDLIPKKRKHSGNGSTGSTGRRKGRATILGQKRRPVDRARAAEAAQAAAKQNTGGENNGRKEEQETTSRSSHSES